MRSCMKKYGFRIYISYLAAVSVVSAGWWGILYPEFSFSQDTFSATVENEADEKDEVGRQEKRQEQEMAAEISGSEVFFAMLEAQPGEIEIKSRFLEEVFDIRGNENEQQCTNRDF